MFSQLFIATIGRRFLRHSQRMTLLALPISVSIRRTPYTQTAEVIVHVVVRQHLLRARYGIDIFPDNPRRHSASLVIVKIAAHMLIRSQNGDDLAGLRDGVQNHIVTFVTRLGLHQREEARGSRRSPQRHKPSCCHPAFALWIWPCRCIFLWTDF